MTELDELAFSRVLCELVPDILFYEHGGRANSRIRRIPNIPASNEWQVYFAVPEPNQLAEWARNFDYDRPVVEPALYGFFQRSAWEWPDPTKKWAFDPPLMTEGNISIGFPCRNDDLRRLAEQIARQLSKVTTFGKRRFGLDACRWSQAGGGERRGLGPGVLIDPGEKINLNKYYDDSLWDDRLPDEPTGVRVEY
jgi:hypothetical protein